MMTFLRSAAVATPRAAGMRPAGPGCRSPTRLAASPNIGKSNDSLMLTHARWFGQRAVQAKKKEKKIAVFGSRALWRSREAESAAETSVTRTAVRRLRDSQHKHSCLAPSVAMATASTALGGGPVDSPPGAPMVVVVGAGVAGLACAHELRIRGIPVTIVEASG